MPKMMCTLGDHGGNARGSCRWGRKLDGHLNSRVESCDGGGLGVVTGLSPGGRPCGREARDMLAGFSEANGNNMSPLPVGRRGQQSHYAFHA